MEKSDTAKIKLPDSPGVYFFLGPRKQILYIGKATSLRNRVQSYFSDDIADKRSKLISNMVSEAKNIEYTVTDSVLEALILETNLIRTHKPTYNTRSKDDKSYNHLIITNEDFPRVLIIRGKDLTKSFQSNEIKYEFGPFPSGQLFKDALKIVRKLFQFYDTKKPIREKKSKLEKGKINFNRQIGLYPSEQSRTEYNRTIRHIRLFFKGKKDKIISELQKEMMRLAAKQEFEAANETKRKIFALKHIQDVSLMKREYREYRDDKSFRIEAYDIAHLQGKHMVGVMTVLDSGEPQKSEYRKFRIKTITQANDPAALKEALGRRLTHTEWPLPQLIVVDGAVAQKNVIQRVLQDNKLVIPVVAVVKDDKHKPIRIIGPGDLIANHKDQILLANAESHRFALNYHREKRGKKLTE